MAADVADEEKGDVGAGDARDGAEREGGTDAKDATERG
jgi:hypothetical protein